LSGYPPFDPEQGITELDFPSPDWDEVSQQAKDVITNLLDDDPAKRMTISQLRAHPWVSGENVSKTKLNRTIKSMSNFNTYRKVATAALPSRQRRSVVFVMTDEGELIRQRLSVT
jgi:serine/threonine protein kinase